MNFLLGKFKMDAEKWKQGIEADKAAHKDAGLHFHQVWRNVDNAEEIYFLFKVDDVAKARSFLQQAGALDKEKTSKGEIPLLTFVETA